MKNIAILDFTLSKQHIRFNTANFEELRKIANLYIVNCEDYYSKFAKKYNNVFLFESGITWPKKELNSINGRLNVLNNMKLNSRFFKHFKDVKFEAVIIMGFEIITFSLYKRYLPKGIPIYIFQHQQLDELENGIKRMFFNTFKNKVHHIVLEEPYKTYMEKELGVKNVHVVHYVSYVSGERDIKKNSTGNLLLAISGHNDENLVAQIIKAQKEKNFLDKLGLKMYVRSSENNYEDKSLFVGYEYLSAEQYDGKFKEASTILAIIPSYFHHRLSGPVLDAITTGKKVLCSNKYIYDTYVDIAPSMFSYFSNVEELIKILENMDFNVLEQDISRIQELYRPEYILKEYRDFLQ